MAFQAIIQRFKRSLPPGSTTLAEGTDITPLYYSSPARMRRFTLEITGHCKLRCVYCPQSGTDYKELPHLTEGSFNDVLDYLKRNPPEDTIDLTGTGDMLAAPGWVDKCQRLLAEGIKLAVTVPLARILDDAEIEMLARFSVITVSIDTLDKKILSEIRRSVDVRTMVYNMMRIKAAAIRDKNTELKWTLSAVYTAEVVNTLPELAAFTAAFGAFAFSIQDLIDFPGVKHGLTSVWTLKGMDAVKAATATQEALATARAHGMLAILPPKFDDRVEKFKVTAYQNEQMEERNIGSVISSFSPVPEKGYTRNCFDPWIFMHLHTDNKIRPCCISNLTTGNVSKDEGGIEGAINSEVVVNLRKQLLTGELDELCSICTLKQVVPIKEFQDNIRKELRLDSANSEISDTVESPVPEVA